MQEVRCSEGATKGNTADDILMVDQGFLMCLTISYGLIILPEPNAGVLQRLITLGIIREVIN